MGTRLYVNTKDALTLDMLADVPRGTYVKYEKIKNLPESTWQRPEVRKRLMDAIAKDPDSCQWYSHELHAFEHPEEYQFEEGYIPQEPTLEQALEAETTMCGQPGPAWMYQSLWMRLVCNADIQKMNSFMDEGFGRIQMDESYLVRITKDPENGHSVGKTQLFTQVAAILRKQADANKLIFNAEDWTIQSLTYTGEPYIGWGNPDISNTSLWRRGPRVKIANLKGVSWY